MTLPSPYVRADEAAIIAYRRAIQNGAIEALAFRIASSVWFAHCPWTDGAGARARLAVLIRNDRR